MMVLKTSTARRLRQVAPMLIGLSVAIPIVQAAPAGKNGATVEVWAKGLSRPQGLARDERGAVLVVENGAGRVTRFAPDGSGAKPLATGLQAPAWALFHGGALYVSERKGNSIARVAPDGAVTRLTGEIIDPLGLALDPKQPGSLLAVSHRQSVVRRFAPERGATQLSLQPESYAAMAAEAKYGWRDLAVAPDGTLYITDEVSSSVLRRSPGGKLEPWATKLSSPSGLAFSPQGELFVTEEGNGRVSRVNSSGSAEVIAEGLGVARAILFLDPRTFLVSDRGGDTVWKVTLPA